MCTMREGLYDDDIAVNLYTVNPFMFACPLFREFRELNETAKLKGVNIDTVAISIGITHVLELCGSNSPK